MSRVCEICGKGKIMGNSVTTRGRAKRLKGVGTKVTGITAREFRPNLQNVRVSLPNGGSKRMRVCTQCLRCDAVVKRVCQKPFRMANANESK